MSKKQIYGTMEFRYDNLMLPLDVAHKIQALLAEHAIKVDTIYCGNRNPATKCIRPYEVSPVNVMSALPDYDCSDMSSVVYDEWKDIVNTRDKGAPVIDPKDFATLTKDGEE